MTLAPVLSTSDKSFETSAVKFALDEASPELDVPELVQGPDKAVRNALHEVPLEDGITLVPIL